MANRNQCALAVALFSAAYMGLIAYLGVEDHKAGREMCAPAADQRQCLFEWNQLGAPGVARYLESEASR